MFSVGRRFSRVQNFSGVIETKRGATSLGWGLTQEVQLSNRQHRHKRTALHGRKLCGRAMASINTLFLLSVAQVFSLLHVIPLCQAGGFIEVYVIRFQTSCEDNTWLPWGSDPCDTFFKFCIDNPSPPDFGSCGYRHFGPTNHFDNTNSMSFGSSIGGVSNPLVTNNITSFVTHQVMFEVQMRDDELSGSEHLVTMGKNISFTPAKRRASATWKHSSMHSSHYHLWFKYRAYCEGDFYSTQCDVYCLARNDNWGHYTCDTDTGAKICIEGWTGDNCDTDINECAQGVCLNGAECSNLSPGYHCLCPSGFTGQRCQDIDSLCHSQPCQHGGTCTGSMTSYTCHCPIEWTGTNCQQQVDFCQSNPCQNNASCYGSVGNFSCECDAGWTGNLCTVEVHACDSSPCLNGATCTNLPRAEYNCTCIAGFEGIRCESVINPCDPNPCENSGNCTSSSYNIYNCSCVEGWGGTNCSAYIAVESGEQQQNRTYEEGKDIPVTAIVLSIFAVLVIIACIIILFFIRRRKQKKALAARLTDEEHRGDQVVHVAGQDNLAFRNALYDNQANANLDRRAQMPVPSTPTAAGACADDSFFPTKGKQLPDDEQLGAVGGANPYHEIDGDMGPTKCSITTEQKQAAGQLDTRTMAGGKEQEGGVNDYADFRELQRRSMMARQASAAESTSTNPDCTDNTTTSPNFMEGREQAEENHYHDIDDLSIEVANNSNVQYANPPASTALSHYDLPPRHHHDESPGNVQGFGDGYMKMEGSTSRPTSQPTEPDHLESTDDEDDEVVTQEDIDQLRREVSQRSASTTETSA